MDIQPFTSVSADHYELLLMADPSRSMIASYVNRAFKFATEIDNQLVGVILLLPTHPQTLEIVNLAVSKCHQNHGIGTKLLQFAATWAQERHYHTLEIATGSTSLAHYIFTKSRTLELPALNKTSLAAIIHKPFGKINSF